MILGCIADDFTGATDLANTLTRRGMHTVQTIGIPKGEASSALRLSVNRSLWRLKTPQQTGNAQKGWLREKWTGALQVGERGLRRGESLRFLPIPCTNRYLLDLRRQTARNCRQRARRCQRRSAYARRC